MNLSLAPDEILATRLIEQHITVHTGTLVFSQFTTKEILTIWNNKTIQHIFAHRLHKQIHVAPESLAYFLNRLDTIAPTDYRPSLQDFVHSKIKTVGVIDKEKLKVGKNTFIQFIDVGGQRNERKKWANATQQYEGVSCVIFTVSLSEYTQLCYEDDFTNRALESVNLFSEIVNLPELQNVPFVLLFGKADVLPYVTKRVSFKSVFPTYTGSDENCSAIVTFLKDLYLSKYKGSEKNKILPMIINSLDTKQVEEAMKIIVPITLAKSTKGYTFKMWDKFDVQTPFFRGKITKFYDVEINLK